MNTLPTGSQACNCREARHQTKLETTREAELNRYAAMVHVEVPALAWGYEKNPIRRESVSQARQIDQRIARAWKGHPRVMTVGAQAGFLDKFAAAIELLRGELPPCCQTHLHATRKR